MILGELALRLGERRLIGPRVDLGEEVALLDDLAFGEADLHQLAGDLGLTVTVANGVTVPSASRVIGMSPSVTAATRTV